MDVLFHTQEHIENNIKENNIKENSIKENSIKENNTKGLSDDDLDVELRLPKSYIFYGFCLIFRRSTKGGLANNEYPIWGFE